MGCTDKLLARSAIYHDSKTVDDAMFLMKRFHGHGNVLAVERQMRTLALEEVDPSLKVPVVEVEAARLSYESSLPRTTDLTPKSLDRLGAGPGWMS